MSPRTIEQYEEIRENKRATILDAGMLLFSESGYHSTSISAIAKKAKISKGLIYNYFESKESLLKSIIKQGLEEFASVFDLNKDGILSDEEFVFFVKKSFEKIGENLSFWKLYFSLVTQPRVMEILNHEFSTMLEPFIKTLMGFFVRKNYKNPFAETRFLFALLDGIGIHYILDVENYPLKESINKVISMYIKK